MDKSERLEFYFTVIDVEKLHPNSHINFDIYVKVNNKFVLYKNRNLMIKDEDIKKILESSQGEFYIHNKDKKNFREYLEDNVDNILNSEKASIERKAEVLYESAVNVIEDVFKNPRSGETIKRSKAIISSTVDFVLTAPEAFVNLLKIRKHDYYTYTHSVNVCTFLVSLAQTLGIRDKKTLKDIGEGGLLHDLGKSMVPSKIINKSSKLTEQEWSVMKQHPVFGIKIAKETRDISDISLTIIGQHHEKVSGKGYPGGLKGSELNTFAMMSSIVDVYDAITTNRSYSKARTPMEGAKFLLEHKEEFNEPILKKFINMLVVKKETQ